MAGAIGGVTVGPVGAVGVATAGAGAAEGAGRVSLTSCSRATSAGGTNAGAGVALVEQSLAAATARLGDAPSVLLHGGGSEALARHLRNATEVATLVLEGLARWASVETAD